MFAILILYDYQKAFKQQEPKSQSHDILGGFIKHKNVTEEEISISKEKRTCLVCKGGIGGINFMCNDCGAYYCFKCYSALTELENACWSCNGVLDRSKPVTLERKEDKEQIKIEHLSQQAHKN